MLVVGWTNPQPLGPFLPPEIPTIVTLRIPWFEYLQHENFKWFLELHVLNEGDERPSKI